MSTHDVRRPGAIASGRFTWRMLAAVLGSQSVVIFLGALVARGLAGNEASTGFVAMCALAVASLVAAGLVRRPGGVALGWAVEVAMVLCGVLVPMMFLVGGIFLGLWVLCLRAGRRIDAQEAAQAAGDGDPSATRLQA